MIILPAIDLINGKCVRLEQGNEKLVTNYNDDPVVQAKKFQREGAKYLHLINLDGAFGNENANGLIIEKIRKNIDIPIEVGGGIRSVESAEKYLEMGIDRIILGTIAVERPDIVQGLCDKYKGKIAVSADCYEDVVAVKGWVHKSDKNVYDFSKFLRNLGVETIIYTDIHKDGMLIGPNFHVLKRLNEEIGGNIIASGGVTTVDNIKKLMEMNLYGAIVGKALYEGNITMEEIMAVSEVENA